MKNQTPVPQSNRNHWLIVALVILAIGGFSRLRGQSLPDHTFHPTNPTNPYGLLDMDYFDPGRYGYCKWGNLMSERDVDNFNLFTFSFTPRTAGPSDVFALKSSTDLSYAALPTSDWSPPTVTFPAAALPFRDAFGNPVTHAALMRKLHFLNTTLLDVNGSSAQLQNVTKAIILVHGWNSSGDENSYAVSEFSALISALISATQNRTDWALLRYKWEADADTGPISFGGEINGTEAAEIGHLHGQHLGELLERATQHRIEKVHFITHSAGAWVARAAMKYLLSARQNPSQSPRIKVQLTLLDPFIPGAIPFIDSSLSKERMGEVDGFT